MGPGRLLVLLGLYLGGAVAARRNRVGHTQQSVGGEMSETLPVLKGWLRKGGFEGTGKILAIDWRSFNEDDIPVLVVPDDGNHVVLSRDGLEVIQWAGVMMPDPATFERYGTPEQAAMSARWGDLLARLQGSTGG